MNNQKTSRQRSQATLPIGATAAVPAVLKNFGIDADELFIQAGIDPMLLGDPNNVITYSARSRLLKLCIAKTGCEHFGLLVGQRMDIAFLGLLGSLMRSMPDVGAALTALVNYFHIHTQGAITTLKLGEDIAILRYSVTEPMQGATDQIGDGAVVTMLNIMRGLCGPDFKPIEASFTHGMPADTKPFKKLFRSPLYFNANYFALVFSRSWLDIRLPDANEEHQHLLEQQIAAIQARHAADLPMQIKVALRSALLTGHCDEEQIAALFNMTRRTMIRRLKTFDTGFRQLVDECRHDMARQMLENTSLTVVETAEALGYTQASTFIRAFRRWSDTTPARWRAQQQEISLDIDHKPS